MLPVSSSFGDAQISAAILTLVAKRGQHSSACPSDVARSLSDKDWRALMPRVRQIAWQLMQLGELDISQGGISIAAMDAVAGPIRLRLARTLPDSNSGQKA